jgi:cholesterol oxidase
MSSFDYDVLVVGSGFGGSVSALRLSEKGYRVGVLEAGRRFGPDDLPRTSWQLRRFLWMPRLGLRGIQRLTLLDDALILSGCGVGGGSLVYANTLYAPLEPFYRDPQWAHITDWKAELAPWYAQARRMLGVVEAPNRTPADDVVRTVAEQLGVADTYHPTQVGVFFGTPGVPVPDPYFGGAGPERTGCILCGACMTGCRHNAKNTLDRNYLHLAERSGATVHPERQAVDIRPLPGGGYAVDSVRPGAWVRHRPRTFTAQQVVLSAAVLGTLRLLIDARERDHLAQLSDRLGHVVRTNSESILGAVARGLTTDYSRGIAIASSIHPDEVTHIEPVRYGKGSNAMGLLGTLLVPGGGRIPRPLRFLLTAARHPRAFLSSLSVRHWSERGVILLVMQTLDNSLRILPRRGHLGPLSRRLRSTQGHGQPNPTYIPIGHRAARLAAKAMDGYPMGTVNESLLNIPITAHILGGCCIGDSPQTGVIDAYHRVYGHPGLHVCDGSAVSANLGVNPSLTITTMTERAMSFWPNRGEEDPRPPLGSSYQRIAPVPPRAPAVPSHAPAALRPEAPQPMV